jgi:putative transposase
MVGSMGQVGSAGDNATTESLFALLQRNVLDRPGWTSRDELCIAIVTWIERTHHRRRRQVGLGRLIPIEYELSSCGRARISREATPGGDPGRRVAAGARVVTGWIG